MTLHIQDTAMAQTGQSLTCQGPTRKMTGPLLTGTVLLFLGVVIGISISSSKAYRTCYNCVGAASATGCDKITRCSDHQECFEEKVITSLNTHYNSGCRSNTAKKKSQILTGPHCKDNERPDTLMMHLMNTSAAMMIIKAGQKPKSILDPVETSYTMYANEQNLCQAVQTIQNGTTGELTACSKCCDTDFCNVGLCGGGTPTSLRCLSCRIHVTQVTDCDRIEQCDENAICYAHKILDTPDLEERYEIGCINKLVCQSVAHVSVINMCFECCDTPMCNLYKCGHNWTAQVNLPTTTIPALLSPHISGQVTINLNGDTILTCNSDEPGVTYTWLYQGSKSLPHGVSIIGGNHLAIIGANSSNVGIFTCVINKNGLQAVSMTTVTIISEKAHVTSVMVSPNHPQTGHRVDIHCNATGNPQPAVYWSYTDTMGLSYMPISASYLDPTTVRIDNFQPAIHSGTWTCIARNSLGVDRQLIQL